MWCLQRTAVITQTATWQGMQYSIMAICLEQSCRTGEVGHRISETTLPSQGLSASLALVGKEKRQENADGHHVRAIKLTLGAKAQGGTRRWHLHPMTVFVYRFAWKLFRLLARSIEKSKANTPSFLNC